MGYKSILIDPAFIVLVSFFIFILIAAVVFLFKFFIILKQKKDGIRSNDGLLTEKGMERHINLKALKSSSNGFSMMQIEVGNGDLMREKSVLTNEEKTMRVIKERINGLLGSGCKLSKANKDCYIIYYKSKYRESEFVDIGNLIVEECCKPIILSDEECVCPEIFVAFATCPESGISYNELKKALDVAIGVSKRKGVNSFTIHNTKIATEESEEFKQFMQIKAGIEKREFLLYYQPIIKLENLGVACIESHLRWRHPTQGIVPPKDFLEVIEASGDIYWLGLWTFELILEQQKQWRLTYPDYALVCNLNLSAKQLMHESLADDFKRILLKFNKVSYNDICFEISETAIALNDEIIMKNIRALKEIGFLIAVDHYGAELSAEVLEQLPIDMIKLSRSYYRQIIDEEISPESLEDVVDFANKKRIYIVAEGIENIQMLEFAKKLKIKCAQGYYFCRPVPAAECMVEVVTTPWKDKKSS